MGDLPRAEEVTLMRHPILTTSIFFQVLLAQILALPGWLLARPAWLGGIAAGAGIALYLYVTPGVESAEFYFYNCLWWTLLGVLSSVGFGTGLHTFVLYLGPLIAKTTLAAYECNSVDFPLYGPESFLCRDDDIEGHVNLVDILFKVWLEATCWGIGTAMYVFISIVFLPKEKKKEKKKGKGKGKQFVLIHVIIINRHH